ncbi:raffinose/stachyose/melibiose transport system permease protein [Paenibacillus sp. UNCCL117]|uniref:carbohydrate ABC transporter permease n=1 Tax=unclassified Paenibacillus TaxID=185978 RepID=UPI00087E1C2D|nr:MULTISPECIES: carbohydrate ABC transporter permease [unclassified Paenibacillus]SDC26690.1 carbohydrate ABC transporter membrane protein 2, CUT1 family [Paenibacillus sp. cl123]SFW20158.1 raffinose/stachyose/melibiose transport system permease protein [Paenibacillus sp. UNCCL117]
MHSGKQRYTSKLFGLEVVTTLFAILFVVPFYFLVSNSFKSFREILLDAASWPKAFTVDNFKNSWEIIDFPKVAFNSFLITILSVLFIVLLSSMLAYRLVRRPTQFNQFIFVVLVAAMIIPFQSIMLQMVKVTALLELHGTLYGMVFCYIGFGLPMAVFLFHGFIKSVPIEIEEAAIMDGCSPYGVFFRIVLPLVKPIAGTVIILNVLWIWNDYLLPALIIGSNSDLKTIPLAVQSFFGQYTKKWDLAMATLTMSVIPIIVFFLALQRHIVEGVAQGAIKG